MPGRYCGNAEAVLFIKTHKDESVRIARRLDVPSSSFWDWPRRRASTAQAV